MKRKLLTLLGAVLAVSLCWTVGAQAFNGHSGDQVNVDKDEVLDSSFYGAGKHVTIAGTVKGDVYCATQTLEITGTVEGDVLCAAQDVRIAGVVQGDIRVAAQTISIVGSVGDNASLVGQVVSLEDGAKIGRDMSIVAQTARIGGTVERDVVSTSDSLTVTGSVMREVRAFGNTNLLKSTAKVGSFIYTSNEAASIESGAQVRGATDHQYPKKKEKPAVSPLKQKILPLYGLFSMLLVGMLLLLLVPRWFTNTIMLMQQKPGGTVGLGLGVLFAAPVVAVVLCFTVIGIPVGLALFVSWLLVCGSAFLFSSYSLGSIVVAKVTWLQRWPQVAPLLVGSLLFGLLSLIPIVSFLVIIGGLLWGIGGISWAIARAIHNQRMPHKAKKAARIL